MVFIEPTGELIGPPGDVKGPFILGDLIGVAILGEAEAVGGGDLIE